MARPRDLVEVPFWRHLLLRRWRGCSPWWQLLRPGVVVATEAATADVQVLSALLWEAFTSGLGTTEA